MIGKHFIGGDEKAAAKGAEDYITDGKGSRENQRRFFHSMYDREGKVAGFIMVSRQAKDIAELKKQNAIILIMLFVLSVIAAGVCAMVLGNRMRKQLLGYEPSQIARMFMQREEVLDGLEEGLG